MLKIVSYKIAQQYFEDILDDVRDPYDLDETNIGEPGVIDEDNFEDYSADDDFTEVGEPGTQDWMSEVPRTTEEVPEGAKEVEYDDSEVLVADGIRNSEVISFDYINRKGYYAGYRTVEPHYLFTARTTNNLVLVSFDLDVGNIRTFILKNNRTKISKDSGGQIMPNGVRYEGWNFSRRPEIDVGPNFSGANVK